MKRIVICADGTWNRPEENIAKDHPTNVLKLARAIDPFGSDGVPQQVFYDWGVGSYYDPVIGGATGRGLDKNIMDDYRYIVQNYSPGDELFLFGFSRGAYTIRSLCGLIYNCGILKRPNARLVQAAFDLYKNSRKDCHPDGDQAVAFRDRHSHPQREVAFVGAWDTVGALGIPFSFMGLLDKKDEFYDTKIGPNVRIARHALAIDEMRSDFEPTLWESRDGLDLCQVWFAGVHSNIGGSYAPDKSGCLLSDIPFQWMIAEAGVAGLGIEAYLAPSLKPNPMATLHQSRKHIYRSKKPFHRPLAHGEQKVLIHQSVKARWEGNPGYRPRNLVAYLEAHDWPMLVS